MISVIIPMYNAENVILNALDSVKNQTFPADRFEIIVVNDGSTDKSREVVETYILQNSSLNIRLINQENGGVSSARNAGLKKSKGNYIALLDSDDVWSAEKTEWQMRFLEDENLGIDFITSLWNSEKVCFPYQINPDNQLVEITLRKLLIKITGQTSTAIFKREILSNTGFFDENQRYSEDANYWMRISEFNQMVILPKQLVTAGNGKKSFGILGLSADLKEMEKGIQKNILEMYRTKRINLAEYFFYFVISKMKYTVRPIRAKL